MKKTIIAALVLAAATATAAYADNEVLTIELKDGTTQTIPVDNIRQMTFAAASPAASIAGAYTGTNSVVVGGAYTYTTSLTATITANADGTVNFTWPQYSLSGTIMGELTLGTVTIANIPYDETKGGFYLDYSAAGLTQHFTAVKDGTTSMDKDYTLGTPSTILIQKTDTGIKVVNPFKLGAMPFPITATLEATK